MKVVATLEANVDLPLGGWVASGCHARMAMARRGGHERDLIEVYEV